MVAAAVLSIFEENVPFFDVTVKEGIIFLVFAIVVIAVLKAMFGGFSIRRP